MVGVELIDSPLLQSNGGFTSGLCAGRGSIGFILRLLRCRILNQTIRALLTRHNIYVKGVLKAKFREAASKILRCSHVRTTEALVSNMTCNVSLHVWRIPTVCGLILCNGG